MLFNRFFIRVTYLKTGLPLWLLVQYVCNFNFFYYIFLNVFLGFLTFLNGYNVKATTRVQNVFMFCKIGALVLVIIIGVVWMGLGHVQNFHNSFEGTTTNVGKMSKAFYSGIFSYSGWYIFQ